MENYHHRMKNPFCSNIKHYLVIAHGISAMGEIANNNLKDVFEVNKSRFGNFFYSEKYSSSGKSKNLKVNKNYDFSIIN